MCGILLSIGDQEITDKHPGLSVIQHRGPDDVGAVTFTLPNCKVGLGHRRLAIIDLSDNAHQPFSYDNDRFWITFNGELYNYLEIKQELLSFGFSFKSNSDTEVLLAAYMKWGKDCLKRFNGMFAFAIFNKQEKRIFIARDRYGIKPCYYHNDKSNFMLVSEIKQLLCKPGFNAEVNNCKLFHFLNSADFAFDQETMWKDISELTPGHYIDLDLNHWQPGTDINSQAWYEAPFFSEIKISLDDALTEFQSLLRNALKLRERADVPIGFLLSGGIDSSALVGLAHQDNQHMKTYSSSFPGTAIDETPYINDMLNHVKAQGSFHTPTSDEIISNLDKIIWHHDLPIDVRAETSQWLLYQHINQDAKGRKVIIEGQGADEILCGYGDFNWAYLYEKFTSTSWLEFVKLFRSFQKIHNEPWRVACRKFKRMKYPERIAHLPHPLFKTGELPDSDKLTLPAIKREEASINELHRNRFQILRHILHIVDRSSMSHSKEARVPFLDHNLVDFVLQLPSDLKFINTKSKELLRRTVQDLVPPSISQRSTKQGYSSCIPQWAVKNGMKDFIVDILNENEIPFINTKAALQLFKQSCENNAYFDPIIWRIITTNRWLKIKSGQ